MSPRRKLWVIETRDTEPVEPDLFKRCPWEPTTKTYQTRQKARDERGHWRSMGFETRVRCYGPRGGSA